MFSFYFFLPGNQREQNISPVWSHFFPFLFLPVLFNILKCDKGQSIARKCKNPMPYMEPEGEQNFNNFFGYFQISEQKIITQSCRDRSASNLTKGFPWWFDVIAPFKNMLKVWLQEEAIPLLPEVVSSHSASTVTIELLEVYKLLIAFKNLQTCIFFAKRDQLLIICPLMHAHTAKWNHCFYNILCVSSTWPKCIETSSIICVCEK